MSQENRAAQFAPFSALTGHKELLQETARLVKQKPILDQNQIDIINHHLQLILQHIKKTPLITLVYFQKDSYKQGGTLKEKRGHVYKIDLYQKVLIFKDDTIIKINDIISIDENILR